MKKIQSVSKFWAIYLFLIIFTAYKTPSEAGEEKQDIELLTAVLDSWKLEKTTQEHKRA